MNSAWKNENFNFHGGYLTYNLENGERNAFIARFKYRGQLVTMGAFKKALKASGISPKEYVAELANVNSTPMGILENNGALKIEYSWENEHTPQCRITEARVYVAGKLVKTQ